MYGVCLRRSRIRVLSCLARVPGIGMLGSVSEPIEIVRSKAPGGTSTAESGLLGVRPAEEGCCWTPDALRVDAGEFASFTGRCCPRWRLEVEALVLLSAGLGTRFWTMRSSSLSNSASSSKACLDAEATMLVP